MLTKSSSLIWLAVLTSFGCGVSEQSRSEELATRKLQLTSAAAPNSTGIADTIHLSGAIDMTNPFFDTNVSTNGRSCMTCHAPEAGWTVSPQIAQQQFADSSGTAPLFNLVDTGTNVGADVSTTGARVQAFKATTVKKALIRFARVPSATAQFTVLAVDDPNGNSTVSRFASFRRPTPTVNAIKSSTATWTGGPHTPLQFTTSISGGAARLHGQLAAIPPAAIVNQMAELQLGLISAQAVDDKAGPLDADGAKGGPQHLADQAFYIGINDIQGNDPSGEPFNPKVFNIFDAWRDADVADNGGVGQARASIARGQDLFNEFPFDISGVPGLNDVLGQEVVRGSCSTCHNAPNVGNHSVARWMDIGVTDEANRAPEITLLTIQNKTTGEIRKVTDLGRGLNSGAWTDVGRFRVPPLRSLSARAPYFHDGQAADLKEVIRYYDERFSMGLSGSQKQDLEAFLAAL